MAEGPIYLRGLMRLLWCGHRRHDLVGGNHGMRQEGIVDECGLVAVASGWVSPSPQALACHPVAPPMGGLRLASHLRAYRIHRSGNGSGVRRDHSGRRRRRCPRSPLRAPTRCCGRPPTSRGLPSLHRQRGVDGGRHHGHRHRPLRIARIRLSRPAVETAERRPSTPHVHLAVAHFSNRPRIESVALPSSAREMIARNILSIRPF